MTLQPQDSQLPTHPFRPRNVDSGVKAAGGQDAILAMFCQTCGDDGETQVLDLVAKGEFALTGLDQ